MTMLTVRNLPDDGHSIEAEVREILVAAVKPESRVRLGDAIAALGRKARLSNKDVEVFLQMRERTPAEPLKFE